MTSAIKSRIEWFANLSTDNAPVPTEETKFHRKVRIQRVSYHALRFLTHGDRLCRLLLSPLLVCRKRIGVLGRVTDRSVVCFICVA